MKAALINFLWLLVLTTISILYLSMLSGYLPARTALIVNFVVVPILLGLVGFYVFSGSVLQIVIWACAIALVHVLWFGGDPTKPGLENALMYLEMVFIALGVGVGWAVKIYFLK